jgi:rhodanese-related sulfurtransferase
VSDTRRALQQALALGALSVLVAAAVHFPLVQRFVRGEFRETFLRAADYPGLRLVTLAEAEDLWAGGTAAILDARAAGFFEKGHVPRARNLPVADAGDALPDWVLGLPKAGPIVVYCEGGNCQSSLALARRLHDAGFGDIRVFEGGWEEWIKAGLPEEKGDGQK